MAETAALEYSVLEQAAEWFAVLGAPNVTAGQRQAWQQWLEASPAHREAWRRVEAINAQFNALPGMTARAALSAAPRRRRALKALLLLCAAGGGAGFALRREQAGEYLAALSAHYRTGVGEIAPLPLPDRTQAWLNTDSAADVAYAGAARLVLLRRGEILLHSGQDDHLPARPLLVQARGVRLRALGTRFAVRLTAQGTRLAVYEGAVAVGEHAVVPAGSQVDIIDGRAGALAPAHEESSAWSRRLLIATQMRLADFIAELARYRYGYISCDPALADLRLVGSYPLADTDQALDMLAASLPVRIKRTLPWWLTVTPR
ncbi:FecR domain-containing protein [Duganella sp. P38]|uniref:FecR domain-containing protein n=1 Tax=Duganella sp. P38 TaxID=3423949 RepID=UPI003D7BB405